MPLFVRLFPNIRRIRVADLAKQLRGRPTAADVLVRKMLPIEVTEGTEVCDVHFTLLPCGLFRETRGDFTRRSGSARLAKA